MVLLRNLIGACGLLVASALAGSGAVQAESWDDIVAKAEKEGSLTVLVPPLRKHRAVIETFRAAYPKITLNVNGLPASDFEPKIDSERKAGIYTWDVMVTGQGPTSYTLYLANRWLAPVREVILPENAKDDLWIGGFDASFLDRSKKYFFAMQATRPQNFYVNRTLVPESELRTFTDVADPKWKGRIAMFDPRVGGPGGSAAARLIMALGVDGATKFFQDQTPAFTTTNRQLTEWVLRGQYPIGVGLSDEDVLDYQSRGLGLDIKPIPGQAATVTPQWGVISLFDNAPHPNAARVFINWMLSKETQSEWSKQTGTNSRRLDAERGAPDNVVDAETWTKGIDLSAEDQLQLRLQTDQLVRSVLK